MLLIVEGERFKVSGERCGVSLLMLGGRDVAQRGVQPDGVKPGDVLDDGELELGVGAPHAVGDQLGLE